MLKFIQVTDPHLVAGDDLFGLVPAQRFRAAVDSIARNHADAAFCVLTGDVTHLGEEAAFAKASDVLAGLPMPCYPIPGNHDLRDPFRRAFPDTPTDPNGFIQYGLDVDIAPGEAARFVFLDTMVEGRSEGLLCADRLDWLAGELATHVAKPVYLFLHHAPLKVGIDWMDNIMLTNADDLHALLVRHGDVRHLFFGHLHRPVHGTWRGLPYSTIRATAHQVALNFAPGAPLGGARENPAYAVIFLDGENVVIHDHSYLEEDQLFDYVRPGTLEKTGTGDAG